AALGGMIFPALIYALINFQDDIAMQGWAIPTATDIAFSLGILILLGKRVPSTLKVFLVSLALFDDLGAIIIIALFYTHNLSMSALLVSAGCIALLWAMNRAEVVSKAAYLMVGAVMWGALLQSGVHATLAGVILAMFIPLQGIDWEEQKTRPLHELEHDLYSPVGLIVLPLFAFANAGLSFSQLNLSDVFQNVPLGIILGLFVGKQAGVMLTVWLGIKLNIGAMSKNVDWPHIYGIAVLCGVGFTMSLFIGGLAFEQSGPARVVHDRLGILLGSLLSALWAVIWLLCFCRNDRNG
ncbi:MAG TPA: Na+/H+ antiporter NhaA, partial [Psychromonas sp.]